MIKIVLISIIGFLTFYFTNGEILLKLLLSVTVSYTLISIFHHPKTNFNIDPFCPAVIFKIVFLIGYLFGLIYLSNENVVRTETLYYVAIIGFEFITVLDIILYFVTRPVLAVNNNPQKSFLTNKTLLVKYFYILYFFCWIWRLYALQKGLLYGTFLATRMEVTASGNIIGTLNNLGQVLFFGITIFSKAVPYWLFPLELIWALISGSKAAIIYAAFPFIFILYRKGIIKINYKLILSSVFILIFIFLSFIYVQTYRIESTKIISEAGAEAYSFFEVIDKLDFREIPISETSTLIVDRINLAKYFALIIDNAHYKNWDLWWGNSYYPILVWYIPRLIWSNKPIVSIGHWVGMELFGWDLNTRTEASVTIWGEAYLNFDWIGVFLIPVLWVVLNVLIYNKILNKQWGLLFYASIMVKFVLSSEQNLAGPIVSFQQTVLIVIAIYISSLFLKNIMSIIKLAFNRGKNER